MPVLSSFLATAVLVGKTSDFIPLAGRGVRGNTDTQIDNIYHASPARNYGQKKVDQALPTDDPLFNDPRQAGGVSV